MGAHLPWLGHSALKLALGPPALGQTESYSVQPRLPLAATIESLFLLSLALILDGRAMGGRMITFL